MKLRIILALSIISFFYSSCSNTKDKKAAKTYTPEPESCILPKSGESLGNYVAHKIKDSLVIDGLANDKDWERAVWRDIKYLWIGDEYSQQDFQGRYKILWSEGRLYFLVEIVDNVLSDQHDNPLENWWDDDCLEIFIDEDKSKGEHQYSHNAFAYHIALDYNVVDYDTEKSPRLYNDHIEVKRTAKGNLYTWEVSMKVYSDKYNDDSQNNIPVKLNSGKKLGFAISYNDNDGTGKRENFIGSIDIPGEDKNKGWIDAGVFGELELID